MTLPYKPKVTYQHGTLTVVIDSLDFEEETARWLKEETERKPIYLDRIVLYCGDSGMTAHKKSKRFQMILFIVFLIVFQIAFHVVIHMLGL